MTGRSTFRQADVVRALKAAKDAGLAIASFEITPDGRIIVYTDIGSEEAVNPVEARRRRLGTHEPKGWGE